MNGARRSCNHGHMARPPGVGMVSSSPPGRLKWQGGKSYLFWDFETCELPLMVLYNSLHILRMFLSSFWGLFAYGPCFFILLAWKIRRSGICQSRSEETFHPLLTSVLRQPDPAERMKIQSRRSAASRLKVHFPHLDVLPGRNWTFQDRRGHSLFLLVPEKSKL